MCAFRDYCMVEINLFGAGNEQHNMGQVKLVKGLVCLTGLLIKVAMVMVTLSAFLHRIAHSFSTK